MLKLSAKENYCKYSESIVLILLFHIFYNIWFKKEYLEAHY